MTKLKPTSPIMKVREILKQEHLAPDTPWVEKIPKLRERRNSSHRFDKLAIVTDNISIDAISLDNLMTLLLNDEEKQHAAKADKVDVLDSLRMRQPKRIRSL